MSPDLRINSGTDEEAFRITDKAMSLMCVITSPILRAFAALAAEIKIFDVLDDLVKKYDRKKY